MNTMKETDIEDVLEAYKRPFDKKIVRGIYNRMTEEEKREYIDDFNQIKPALIEHGYMGKLEIVGEMHFGEVLEKSRSAKLNVENE